MSDISIGVVVLCAKWFKEVGLQGKSGKLSRLLERDYVCMVRFLEKCFGRIMAPGIISTVGDAARAAHKFREEKIDALLIVHIMWSEDPPLLEILKKCRDLSILIWNYHPTGKLPAKLQVNDLFRFSGTVGMLQGSAPLQRAALTVPVVSGSPGDSRLARTLREYDTALKIRKGLQNTLAGRIAGCCKIMTGTHVNPGRAGQYPSEHVFELAAGGRSRRAMGDRDQQSISRQAVPAFGASVQRRRAAQRQ